jgi:hypothetical protein
MRKMKISDTLNDIVWLSMTNNMHLSLQDKTILHTFEKQLYSYFALSISTFMKFLIQKFNKFFYKRKAFYNEVIKRFQ